MSADQIKLTLQRIYKIHQRHKRRSLQRSILNAIKTSDAVFHQYQNKIWQQDSIIKETKASKATVHQHHKTGPHEKRIIKGLKNSKATLGSVPPSECSHCQGIQDKLQERDLYLHANWKASQIFPLGAIELPLESGSLKARLLGSSFTPIELDAEGEHQRPCIVFTRIIWPSTSKPRVCDSCNKISPAEVTEKETNISSLQHADQEQIWSECYAMATARKDTSAMRSYDRINLENIQAMTCRIYSDKISTNTLRRATNHAWRTYLANNSLLRDRNHRLSNADIRRELQSLNKNYPLPPKLNHQPPLIPEAQDFRRYPRHSSRTHHRTLRHIAQASVFAPLRKWDTDWASLDQPPATDLAMSLAKINFDRVVLGKRDLCWGSTRFPHCKRGWTGLTHAELPERTCPFVRIGHVMRRVRGEGASEGPM